MTSSEIESTNFRLCIIVPQPTTLPGTPTYILEISYGRFVPFGVVAPRPTLGFEDQGQYFVWHLPLDLSGIHGPTKDLRSRQLSSPGRWRAPTSSSRLVCGPWGQAYLTQAEIKSNICNGSGTLSIVALKVCGSDLSSLWTNFCWMLSTNWIGF
jgi:hypothetical protein